MRNRHQRAIGFCASPLLLFAAALLTAAPAVADASDAQLQCLDAFEATQEARQAGNLRRARALSQQCAADNCLEAIRSECRKWVDELATEVPSVVLRVTDSEGNVVGGSTIQLNGEATLSGGGRAIELDPGTHSVKVERVGYLTTEQTFEIRAGQRDVVVELKLEPAEEEEEAPIAVVDVPDPGGGGQSVPMWPAYVAGGVAAAGFATLAILGSSARSADRELDDCAESKTCDPARVEGIQSDYLLANIGLGVGILGAAAGIGWGVFALTQSDERAADEPPPSSAQLVVGPGSLAVTGSF